MYYDEEIHQYYDDPSHNDEEQDHEQIEDFFQNTHGDRVCSFDLLQEKLKDQLQSPHPPN